MGAFDELETLLEKIQSRLTLVEKVGLLFLTPLDDEMILDSNDIKTYVEQSPHWHFYSGSAYHYRENGAYSDDQPEVEMDWSELRWNHEKELKILLLHIAACEGRRPEKLFDEIWPHRRDVIERLADVPTE
jgi:hypothetical protein